MKENEDIRIVTKKRKGKNLSFGRFKEDKNNHHCLVSSAFMNFINSWPIERHRSGEFNDPSEIEIDEEQK